MVTDGSLTAHAALVASELGIPPAALVTGHATVRLTDGEWVSVDGSPRMVEAEQ